MYKIMIYIIALSFEKLLSLKTFLGNYYYSLLLLIDGRRTKCAMYFKEYKGISIYL